MRYVHYFEGELRYRMPTNSKNYITLAKSNFGASIDHDKSAIILDVAVGFTVICRRLMRRLLERNAVDAAEKLEKLEARALRKKRPLRSTKRKLRRRDGARREPEASSLGKPRLHSPRTVNASGAETVATYGFFGSWERGALV